ncbi:hypothetical protein Ccar_11665 [Clostridium carboxidivorans P7]|uniref:Uncharacterized protein n=1 Tax=Clostridium carboxidivorans P7 TaxID=536227 RepID=C6PRI3_9CLOT|nr:hypothetical protein [Clostridium carboxidivorans]AKN31482.1 hypothetical protein Ccar_11665 [Clostridium carboxidivorans P7]EET88164.1 hypothetical protein CcarbDRAFT_1400 [Clostridium carboxidivorans P7]EFG87120.1 hypothetical protein CLCAR_3221 [Clostridium carboxidivorans P7]
MKRYFYQTQFSEYKPGLITYLNKRNKVVVKINNLYFYKYLKKVVGAYKKLEHYYELYSLKVKKIVEQDGIDLENINEILKLEMYLYNIVSIYEDDTLFEENFEFEEYMEDWIHKIDENTLLCYFSSKHDLDILNEKKIFSNVFSNKPKVYGVCKKNFGS